MVHSIIVTFVGLPLNMRTDFWAWNGMTHGSITFVVVLFSVRCVHHSSIHVHNTLSQYYELSVAWFLGIGRTRYYFGQTVPKKSE